MKSGSHIGIDFGTTNTAVSRILRDEHGFQIRHLGVEGEYPFPSMVAIPKKGGKLLFGKEVKEKRNELSKDYTIFASMKTLLEENEEFIVNNKKYTATRITGYFLKYIKRNIKENHNIDIKEATITCPNNFDSKSRLRLKSAAKYAGIRVRGYMSESTAAYIANRDMGRAHSKVMVVDWGGGTVDISILDLTGTRIYEKAVFGDDCGGDDIDLILAEKIHSKLANQTGIETRFDEMNAAQRDQMISTCEAVKREFSVYDDEVQFGIRDYGEFGTKVKTIDYNYFKAAINPIIRRVIIAIEKTMRAAQTNEAGIDAVILVGGSCDLKLFEDVMIDLFGEDKIIKPNKVQWSVALGAAYLDIIDGDYYLNDDIGVRLSDDTVYPILKREEAKVGYKSDPITFLLTEDSSNARFIFTNGDNNINYGIKNVATKGFLREELELTGEIGIDQTAKMTIYNDSMGDDKGKSYFEINKLKFYYNLYKISGI